MLVFGTGTLRWVRCNNFGPKRFLDSLFLEASPTRPASDASLGLLSVTARQLRTKAFKTRHSRLRRLAVLADTHCTVIAAEALAFSLRWV